MAWNLMKKRRDNLEKDRPKYSNPIGKVGEEPTYSNPIGKVGEEPKFENPIGKTEDIEHGPKNAFIEPSLSVKAQQRGLDISNAQKDSDEPAISGPFPGGGKGKGTWSGALGGEAYHGVFGGQSGKATPPPPQTTVPDTPGGWAEHHEKQAEKYKPGDQTIPSQGTPNLSPEEKKELDQDINMKPRE